MEQLLQKLAKSKAIMDLADTKKRGDARPSNLPQNMVSEFDVPQAKYNIPEEFLNESSQPQMMQQIPQVRENTKPVGVPTVDAIKKSKLPEEIKRLMIEHPISQPQEYSPSISNDLIEKASRLMKRTDSSYPTESVKEKTSTTQTNIDYKVIQKMINEAVENAIRKTGLVAESSEKTNEMFSFRVGKHLFEGKITKVKKLS